MRLLHRLGADIHAGYGGYGLQSLLHRSIGIGSETSVKVLLELGANVDGPLLYEQGSQYPLYRAVKHGKVLSTKVLLQKDADINATAYDLVNWSQQHTIALFKAIRRRDRQMVQIQLDMVRISTALRRMITHCCRRLDN
jgi:ABC-type Mn2+/Zn2+ transport system ATPase subunit